MVEFISSEHLVHKLISPDPEVSKSLVTNTNPPLPKPKFIIKKEASGLLLFFPAIHGFKVKIFCKRATEDIFTPIGETSTISFSDNRPNLYGVPELREYKAQYLLNDKPHGEMSDIILVIKK